MSSCALTMIMSDFHNECVTITMLLYMTLTMTLCDPSNDFVHLHNNFGCPHNDSLWHSQWLYDLYNDSVILTILCMIQALTLCDLTMRLCNLHKTLCDHHHDLCALRNNNLSMILCSLTMALYSFIMTVWPKQWLWELTITWMSSQMTLCTITIHVTITIIFMPYNVWPSQWHCISSQWLLSPYNNYMWCHNDFVLIITIWFSLWIFMTLCPHFYNNCMYLYNDFVDDFFWPLNDFVCPHNPLCSLQMTLCVLIVTVLHNDCVPSNMTA